MYSNGNLYFINLHIYLFYSIQIINININFDLNKPLNAKLCDENPGRPLKGLNY